MKPEDVKALKFPEGTEFFEKEGDVPFTRSASGDWTPWYGWSGKNSGPTYKGVGPEFATPCTREEWDEIVIASLSRSKPT